MIFGNKKSLNKWVKFIEAFFGAPTTKLSALTYPHDIINYIPTSKDNIFEICSPLYSEGCNLLQISKLTGYPRTTIRRAFNENGVELRVFKRSSLKLTSGVMNSAQGGSPFGYCYKEGKLIPDKKEYRVVIAIYALWRKGTPLKAIVDHLHKQKTLTRMNKKWTQVAIERIIQRHEELLNKGK